MPDTIFPSIYEPGKHIFSVSHTVPLDADIDIAWDVIMKSLCNIWDPIQRAQAVENEMRTSQSRSAPIVEIVIEENCRTCIVVYRDSKKFHAKTTHTLELEMVRGKVVLQYTVDDEYSGKKMEEELAKVLSLPVTESESAWRIKIAEAVEANCMIVKSRSESRVPSTRSSSHQ